MNRSHAKLWQHFLRSQKGEVEAHTSLVEYVATIPHAITDDPPVGYDAAAAPVDCRRLARETQLLMLQSIHMLDDVFESGHAVVGLRAAHIVVSEWTRGPLLAPAGVKLVKRTPKLEKKNMRRLAQIFRTTILTSNGEGKALPPPAEVEHLLHLMRNHAARTRYLIKHHPCLVPPGNRTIYTTRLVERVWRLFLTNQPGLDYVVRNLAYPHDWHIRVRRNEFMMAFYRDGDYDPEAAEDEATVPAVEALRYNYESAMNGLRHAVDKRTRAVRFSWTGIGHMLYSVFDMTLASAALSLHRIGQLVEEQVDSLFPLGP